MHLHHVAGVNGDVEAGNIAAGRDGNGRRSLRPEARVKNVRLGRLDTDLIGSWRHVGDREGSVGSGSELVIEGLLALNAGGGGVVEGDRGTNR